MAIWIKQLGLDAEYRREAVPPDQFADFVTSLAEHGYVGANVTIPTQGGRRWRCRRRDDRATAVGAANTLWLERGTLRSTNTDVEGFIEQSRRHGVAIGTGASRPRWCWAPAAPRARSCTGCLQRDIARIHVVNRSLDRAVALREQFGERINPCDGRRRMGCSPAPVLLVNTTSLGMIGHPPLSINLDRLPPSAVVADVVYAPLETPLLAAARARGFRTVDGLGMLLHQAVGGFERWFGVRPQVTPELRALVEADLLRK